MCVEHKDRNDEHELAEFERKLRMAMQHREAPLGMKQRVLARARERRQAQRGRFWMLQRIAASILLAAAVGGFAAYRHNEERVAEQKRGAEAREQVMTALRITSKTLGRVNERLTENDR
jgi:hypothetical protein